MSLARKPNRLAEQTSPYLLQHAHNPVDWYPWGEEALARARSEDKPILLSIGYAACHWCHVMERESFESEAIAQLMNEHYVCIKVDREERPDLDDVYMAATIAMTGQGGWPMTVFLTPEKKPFFAGTYFPPEDKYGRPGFPTLLMRIAELWKSDRDGIEKQASELTSAVREQLGTLAKGKVTSGLIERAVATFSQSYDPRWGGFGGAPKFPPSSSLRLLLRHYARTQDQRALEVASGTLTGMKNGGMYDHIGGGFARYSVDEKWHVPHFEKMLYDNAQLARVYIEASQITDSPEYRRVAIETLDYVLREMQSPTGGFYSATDADSEGVEGKFFTFTVDEIRAILAPPLDSQVCAYYDITSQGNWEHTNVLWTPRPMAQVAEELGVAVQTLDANLSRAREKLYAARKDRVPPLLDDKILVSWNALMIGALSEAARVLEEPRYREGAERAARDLLEHLRRPDGGLYRTARAGKAHLDAYLEDYAYLADALIDLYESGAGPYYLDQALQLCERMIKDFRDLEGGGFFHTAHGHEALIARSRDVQDDALPNANAVAAMACVRLSYHFDRPDLRSIAEGTVESYGQLLEKAPRAFVSMLAVVDLLTHGPAEIAIVGALDDPRTQALLHALSKRYLAQRVIAYADGQSSAQHPLVKDKSLVHGDPALYVCKDFACQAPVTSPEDVPRAFVGS